MRTLLLAIGLVLVAVGSVSFLLSFPGRPLSPQWWRARRPPSAEETRALIAGSLAWAEVLELHDPGMVVRGHPYVTMVLAIHRAGSAVYQADCNAVVPAERLAEVQPGEVVQVAVDAEDPSLVELRLPA